MLAQVIKLAKPPAFIDISKRFADLLKVPVTQTALAVSLEDHPDYPSLLSMSDVLLSFGISNIALTVTMNKLAELPLPFIAQIKDRETGKDSLAIIREVKRDSVSWYTAENPRWEEVPLTAFAAQWPSGTVLIADAEDAAGEKDYRQHRRTEQRLQLAKTAGYMALPVAALVTAATTVLRGGAAGWWPAALLLLMLTGALLTVLLLWYELDQYNPVLQKICSSGKKVNCGAVLHSKASKIAGISWSNIGFTWFAGGLLLLLFTGVTSPPALLLTGMFSVVSIPYIFFSVYYQWRIARQWCVLCMGVQSVLLLQFLVTLAGGWLQPVHFDAGILLTAAIAYLLPFAVVSILVPALRQAKDGRRSRHELQRLKHNTQIFEALMGRQKAVTTTTDGIGIVLGNPAAKHRLVKVCNPYCGPCADAHKPIEELLENNPDVQLQIIFTATNQTDDRRALPARHLLAIAEKNDEALTRQALDDWYTAAEKDYASFAAKYPMNGELKQQDEKITAMMQWCEALKISFTPTIFVDGYQLPGIYSVEDLKYFLAV
ncbi:vitamin K epoxide reductase family protein [Chitinophaga solisilvae]|uniref:vitamin K epoxide reductase family protein n=1 Tax=Chitinophaga solisilvae TaxID=1233460 RepID=UPI00136AE17E|nr:vitamin K epoxide reductase family protein [Chitinophaga solisilvae]